MPDEPRKPDILHRLRYYAENVESADPGEIEEALLDAIDAIMTLRTLAGIKEEIWLEDEPPQGHG